MTTAAFLASGARAGSVREANVPYTSACLVARPIRVAVVDRLLALRLDRQKGLADIYGLYPWG